MSKGRLETFTDGVIAILITITVLDLHVPHGSDASAILPVLPVFFVYILSFAFLGIYWNNHHHMFTLVQRVSGGLLWANLHLLFWLSLVPFVTGWMAENNFDPLPEAAYGGVLLMAGVGFYILLRAAIATDGRDGKLATAIGSDVKGKLSLVIYLLGIPLAYVNRWVSLALYIAVALMWLVPDRRVERVVR